jgi:serine/threonine protein phosphatase 1
MLGDYVDRGPDSRRVIQWLIDQSDQRKLICLKGNHELMMLRARTDLDQRRSWSRVGGAATWQSYGGETPAAELAAVPESHWEFIEACLPYYETDTHIYVHAALDGRVPLDRQTDYMLYWEKYYATTPAQSGKQVICGHTSQKDGLPKHAGHVICIDTWACGAGWLTCLDVQSGRYYQANQAGQTRSAWLEEAQR